MPIILIGREQTVLAMNEPAERLLGWLMLTLNEATHLIYRPRKFLLPDGRAVDSIGRPYDPNASTEDDDLYMEKVSLALVDDLTVGDAINFFSIHEAPYRPFLTYLARVAMDGPLVEGTGGTTIRVPRLGTSERADTRGAIESPSGRMMSSKPNTAKKKNPGPEAHNIERIPEEQPESPTED